MKWLCWCSVFLSIISIIVSVFCVCIDFPHSTNLGFDYSGVIVGIFSLLITILIAWQISTMISIDRRFESVAKKIVNESVEKAESKLSAKAEGILEIAWWANVNNNISSGNILDAFTMSIQALGFCGNSKGIEKYKNIILRYYEISDMQIDSIDQEKLKSLMRILEDSLSKWNNEEKVHVLDIIKVFNSKLK